MKYVTVVLLSLLAIAFSFAVGARATTDDFQIILDEKETALEQCRRDLGGANNSTGELRARLEAAKADAEEKTRAVEAEANTKAEDAYYRGIYETCIVFSGGQTAMCVQLVDELKKRDTYHNDPMPMPMPMPMPNNGDDIMPPEHQGQFSALSRGL